MRRIFFWSDFVLLPAFIVFLIVSGQVQSKSHSNFASQYSQSNVSEWSSVSASDKSQFQLRKIRQCRRVFDGVAGDSIEFKLKNFGAINAEKIQKLRFLEINSLNLFEYKKVVEVDAGGKPVEVWRSPKPDHQTHALARNILQSNPDIVVMLEVESKKALSQFNEKYLNETYEPLLIEGNDTRGIDIGILVKSELPFKIEVRTHRDLWTQNDNLFSRDLPVLLFREKNNNVKFILLGTHYKSMRGSDSDPNGSKKRTIQAAYTKKVIEELQAEFSKDIPIFLTGDFNNHVPTAPEFESLRSMPMTDVLDLFPTSKRYTHFFFERDGSRNFHQLDAFLFVPNKNITIKSAEILPNKNENGEVLPEPSSFDERENLPSDHLPTQIDIEFH